MTVVTPFIEPRKQDDRLIRREYRMLIGGKSVDARSGERIERESPAYEGIVVSSVPKGSLEDSVAGIMAARKAFDDGPWPRMSGHERATILHRIGEAIYAHREELAVIESLEIGKPIAAARGEMSYCSELWIFAAGHARGLQGETHNSLGQNLLGLMLREPVGVVGIVTPWNFPMIIGSERVPWALGAGCTVVIKPSEFTSGSTVRMAEIARDCGLPDGVFNVVTGYGDPVGQAFAEHPATDFMSFTGSFRVGQIVGAKAAGSVKKVGLELGGKGPQIVFNDASLDAAADKVGSAAFGNSGQVCIAGSRLIVQRGARDEILERLTNQAKKIVVGDPLDETVKMGSVIHRPHLEKIERYVGEGQRDGAEVVFGGSRLGNAGNYYAPTVFNEVRPDMSIHRDEIFGPVLSVLTFDTPEEAVQLANDTNYGLSASVWSNDLSKAIQTIRKVRAGRCWINGAIAGSPEMGISGYKQSGIGRELGKYGFDEYSAMKSVVVVLEKDKPWV